MSKKLGDDDRRAVDLLLDESAGNGKARGNGNGQGGYASSVDPALHQRLQAAEKVLQLLAEMPAPEPSPDLVAKTLRRIAEHQLEHPTVPSITPGMDEDEIRPTL